MHIGKELEAHWVQKGRLSCDSDAPKVGSTRSDWTTVVKVNRRKTNRRKTRPYCISFDNERTESGPWSDRESVRSQSRGLSRKIQAVSWNVRQCLHDSGGKERQLDPGEGNVLCLDERRKILYGKRGNFERNKKLRNPRGPQTNA